MGDSFGIPEDIRVRMELADETVKIKSITDLPDVNQAERECYRAGYAEGLLASSSEIARIKELLDKHLIAVNQNDIVWRIEFALNLLEESSDELHTLQMKHAGEI